VLCDCVNILCIPGMNILVVDVVCVCVHVHACGIIMETRPSRVCHRVLMPALNAGCNKVSKVDLWREHARLEQICLVVHGTPLHTNSLMLIPW